MKKTSKTIALSFVALAMSGAVMAANSPRGIPSANSSTANIPSDKRPVITDSSIDFGAYDPHGDFSEDPNSKIEHLFLPWEDVDLSTLSIADEYAQQRGRSLMITIEPWSWSLDWRRSPNELSSGILSGKYDANMAAVCSEAAKLKSPVTIRWGQEMDELDNQFTWAHWKPQDFIAAYRHVVTVCRKHLKTAKYMWSPKGNEGLEAFYPGDEYVDVIGLSVFGYQKYDNDTTGRDQTFVERLTPGYERVKNFGKPIVVAELGYEGDQPYVRNWAENVAKPHPEFPDLTAVVYFNDREVYPWPDGYGRPDWRVVQDASN
ncbi:beta-mannosidase [Phyllobacterium phragmitis]|uniref:Beta-mannosidase n=1 Tax=Phyllobacterium phragmitis TaxID=2670329 RepID=A0A2S9IL76_9HYPH|nr:glycoside hydrolase family 26 protein [Phyllobacterium phragmitis]PRD41258.1 beta-mannosidase [Phyllobacterium phragmitis]